METLPDIAPLPVFMWMVTSGLAGQKTALTGFERLEWPRDHISPEDFFPLTRMDIVQMLCWVFSVPYYFLWR